MTFHTEQMHETVSRLATTYHPDKVDYKYPKSRDVARHAQELFPCAAWLTFGQIQLSIQWHQFSYCSYYRVAQDSTFYYDHPSCYKAEIALIALWASPTGLDIAREYFPNLSDDMLDFFLWEHTSYPFLKHHDREAHLREQLLELSEGIWWESEAEMFPY